MNGSTPQKRLPARNMRPGTRTDLFLRPLRRSLVHLRRLRCVLSHFLQAYSTHSFYAQAHTNMFDDLDTSGPAAAELDELGAYLSMPCEAVADADVLKWWRDRQAQYPHLAIMAISYLTIPGMCPVSLDPSLSCSHHPLFSSSNLHRCRTPVFTGPPAPLACPQPPLCAKHACHHVFGGVVPRGSHHRVRLPRCRGAHQHIVEGPTPTLRLTYSRHVARRRAALDNNHFKLLLPQGC